MSGPNPRGYIPGAGIPLAPPLGSSASAAFPLVEVESASLPATNTSPSTSGEVFDRRVSRRALARIDERLSPRDRLVLLRVAEHGYLTTHQIQEFAFTGHASDGSASRTARRVLGRLERDGLLRSLGRRIGGVRAGSAATVWQLANAGIRLLNEAGAHGRTREPSLRTLAHSLAIADVHLLLRGHACIEAIESVMVEVEPASWRRYIGPGGERRWLQPDLYAELATSEFLDRAFIEVDLGTESLPTLLKKCAQYEAYRRSGTEQERHDSFPLVVWLFTNQNRADKLASAVRRSPKLQPEMFRYATPETLTEVLAGGSSWVLD